MVVPPLTMRVCTIEQATAALCLAEGATVIITGRDRDGSGASTAEALGQQCFFIQVSEITACYAPKKGKS